MYWAGERLGRARIRRAYAYQDLHGQLGMLPLGTDFPVEDIDPRKTHLAAVARQDAQPYPQEGFHLDQALTPAQSHAWHDPLGGAGFANGDRGGLVGAWQAR